MSDLGVTGQQIKPFALPQPVERKKLSKNSKLSIFNLFRSNFTSFSNYR